ncbi:MAG: fibronectin type III domain-containing protein [Acidimicrobiaceae bacterium]|nr:fibronectin type III domain-containing protein [Acidimicrobiaceae bacterium]
MSTYPEWWLRYVEITGLTNGDEYTVRLRSQNQHGWGPWSDEITGTPYATLPKPPEFVLKPGDQQITAKWHFDWGAGTWLLKDHQIQYKLTNSDDWTSITTNPYGKNAIAPAKITGLTNGSEYQVRVRAKLSGQGGDIWSEWSDILTATLDAKYAAPTKPSPTITDIGSGQFTVSWSTNTTSIYPTTLYRLEYKVNTDTSGWTIVRPSPTLSPSNPQTITGLTNGTTYRVRIRALNEAGWSSWSDERTVTPN